MHVGKVAAMCGNAGGGLMADKEGEVIVYGAPVPPASPERQPVGKRMGPYSTLAQRAGIKSPGCVLGDARIHRNSVYVLTEHYCIVSQYTWGKKGITRALPVGLPSGRVLYERERSLYRCR